MVREENVKLMTKMAIYEKHKGKTEIPMSGYYKSDYVRLNVLKTVVAATIAFAIVVAGGAIYQMDFLLANIFKLDYKEVGIRILIVYGVWIFICWLAARIVYAIRYEKARPNIVDYNHKLKQLQEVRQKEMFKAMKGVVINDDFIDF